MIWKPGENGRLMAQGRPVLCQFRSAGGWRTHLWRIVLGHIQDLHGDSVVAQLEDTLIGKRARPTCPAVRIVFPSVGSFGK